MSLLQTASKTSYPSPRRSVAKLREQYEVSQHLARTKSRKTSNASTTVNDELKDIVKQATTDVFRQDDQNIIESENRQSLQSIMRTLSGSSSNSSFSAGKAFSRAREKMRSSTARKPSAKWENTINSGSSKKKVDIGGNLQMNLDFDLPVDRIEPQDKGKRKSAVKADKLLEKLEQMQKAQKKIDLYSQSPSNSQTRSKSVPGRKKEDSFTSSSNTKSKTTEDVVSLVMSQSREGGIKEMTPRQKLLKRISTQNRIAGASVSVAGTANFSVATARASNIQLKTEISDPPEPPKPPDPEVSRLTRSVYRHISSNRQKAKKSKISSKSTEDNVEKAANSVMALKGSRKDRRKRQNPNLNKDSASRTKTGEASVLLDSSGNTRSMSLSYSADDEGRYFSPNSIEEERSDEEKISQYIDRYAIEESMDCLMDMANRKLSQENSILVDSNPSYFAESIDGIANIASSRLDTAGNGVHGGAKTSKKPGSDGRVQLGEIPRQSALDAEKVWNKPVETWSFNSFSEPEQEIVFEKRGRKCEPPGIRQEENKPKINSTRKRSHRPAPPKGAFAHLGKGKGVSLRVLADDLTKCGNGPSSSDDSLPNTRKRQEPLTQPRTGCLVAPLEANRKDSESFCSVLDNAIISFNNEEKNDTKDKIKANPQSPDPMMNQEMKRNHGQDNKWAMNQGGGRSENATDITKDKNPKRVIETKNAFLSDSATYWDELSSIATSSLAKIQTRVGGELSGLNGSGSLLPIIEEQHLDDNSCICPWGTNSKIHKKQDELRRPNQDFSDIETADFPVLISYRPDDNMYIIPKEPQNITKKEREYFGSRSVLSDEHSYNSESSVRSNSTDFNNGANEEEIAMAMKRGEEFAKIDSPKRSSSPARQRSSRYGDDSGEEKLETPVLGSFDESEESREIHKEGRNDITTQKQSAPLEEHGKEFTDHKEKESANAKTSQQNVNAFDLSQETGPFEIKDRYANFPQKEITNKAVDESKNAIPSSSTNEKLDKNGIRDSEIKDRYENLQQKDTTEMKGRESKKANATSPTSEKLFKPTSGFLGKDDSDISDITELSQAAEKKQLNQAENTIGQKSQSLKNISKMLSEDKSDDTDALLLAVTRSDESPTRACKNMDREHGNSSSCSVGECSYSSDVAMGGTAQRRKMKTGSSGEIAESELPRKTLNEESVKQLEPDPEVHVANSQILRSSAHKQFGGDKQRGRAQNPPQENPLSPENSMVVDITGWLTKEKWSDEKKERIQSEAAQGVISDVKKEQRQNEAAQGVINVEDNTEKILTPLRARRPSPEVSMIFPWQVSPVEKDQTKQLSFGKEEKSSSGIHSSSKERKWAKEKGDVCAGPSSETKDSEIPALKIDITPEEYGRKMVHNNKSRMEVEKKIVNESNALSSPRESLSPQKPVREPVAQALQLSPKKCKKNSVDSCTTDEQDEILHTTRKRSVSPLTLRENVLSKKKCEKDQLLLPTKTETNTSSRASLLFPWQNSPEKERGRQRTVTSRGFSPRKKRSVVLPWQLSSRKKSPDGRQSPPRRAKDTRKSFSPEKTERLNGKTYQSKSPRPEDINYKSNMLSRIDSISDDSDRKAKLNKYRDEILRVQRKLSPPKGRDLESGNLSKRRDLYSEDYYDHDTEFRESRGSPNAEKFRHLSPEGKVRFSFEESRPKPLSPVRIEERDRENSPRLHSVYERMEQGRKDMSMREKQNYLSPSSNRRTEGVSMAALREKFEKYDSLVDQLVQKSKMLEQSTNIPEISYVDDPARFNEQLCDLAGKRNDARRYFSSEQNYNSSCSPSRGSKRLLSMRNRAKTAPVVRRASSLAYADKDAYALDKSADSPKGPTISPWKERASKEPDNGSFKFRSDSAFYRQSLPFANSPPTRKASKIRSKSVPSLRSAPSPETLCRMQSSSTSSFAELAEKQKLLMERKRLLEERHRSPRRVSEKIREIRESPTQSRKHEMFWKQHVTHPKKVSKEPQQRRSPYSATYETARFSSPHYQRQEDNKNLRAKSKNGISSPEKRRLLGKYSNQTRELKRDLDLARLTSNSIRNTNTQLAGELESFKKKLSKHADYKQEERDLMETCHKDMVYLRRRLRDQDYVDNCSEITFDTASDDFSEIRGELLTNLKILHDAREELLMEQFCIIEGRDDGDTARLDELEYLIGQIKERENYHSELVLKALQQANETETRLETGE